MSNEEIKKAYYKSYDLEKQRRFKDAIAVLKSVYLSFPNTYTINYRLGYLYYLNQNYANSIEHLNKAATIAPQSTEIIKILIYIHKAKDEWVKVETLSVQILKKDYYNITGNYFYALALKMQGKYSLAIKISNKMLALQPTSQIFLQELGENYFLNSYLKDSKSVFENLLILYPNNPTALYYLNKMKEYISKR